MTFEQWFQAFLATGGFTRPCMSEDIERTAAQRIPHRPERCVHGLTRLTCAECDLRGFRPEQTL